MASSNAFVASRIVTSLYIAEGAGRGEPNAPTEDGNASDEKVMAEFKKEFDIMRYVQFKSV